MSECRWEALARSGSAAATPRTWLRRREAVQRGEPCVVRRQRGLVIVDIDAAVGAQQGLLSRAVQPRPEAPVRPGVNPLRGNRSEERRVGKEWRAGGATE